MKMTAILAITRKQEQQHQYQTAKTKMTIQALDFIKTTTTLRTTYSSRRSVSRREQHEDDNDDDGPI